MCAADVYYHKPVDVIDDGHAVYSKYPIPPYYFGPYKYDYKYDHLAKKESFFDELKDYWKVFVETFKSSYKEITKPYIVERPVPVPVPGNNKLHIHFLHIWFLFAFVCFLSIFSTCWTCSNRYQRASCFYQTQSENCV